MRILFGIVICLLTAATLAQAQQSLDRPANADGLGQAEKRFVQGALTVYGEYDGLLDGVWGPRSQAALDQTVRDIYGHRDATIGDLARLSRRFSTALAGGGWTPDFRPRANLSYLLPRAVVAQQARTDEVAFADSKAQLVIRTLIGSPVETMTLHKWLFDSALKTGQLRLPQIRDQIVSSAVLADRTHTIYIRSIRRGPVFATVLVRWTPQRATEARLIIASIAQGRQPPLILPENGALSRAIAALDRPAPQPTGPTAPDRGRYAGTGFYVNNTDLVTALTTTETCQRLLLGDGSALSALRIARVHGLAILTSARRSEHWLPLLPGIDAEPGQILTAVGYPAAGRFHQGLMQMKGQVTGETLIGNNGLRLVVSVPDRTGTAGAPVLDRDGHVAGVLLGRPEGQTGGMAHVVPVRRLAAILERNSILFDRQPGDDNQPAQSFVQQDRAQAIVPLFCE